MSLIVLVITISVILMIASTVITAGIGNLKAKNLKNMYTDLKSINDKVEIYYSQYETLPLGEKFMGAYTFETVANPNDDPDMYYVVNVNKLKNLVLINKLSWEENDVYIINTKTHTLYYPKGVELDGDIYYRLPGEYSKLQSIDIEPPTVPTITGGSTEWAKSRTISVSNLAIDVGSQVAYYEYYKTSSSTLPTSTTIATGNVGSTATATSITFSDHTAETGEYVYFRAVDGAGNKGEWSNAQRLYIDTQLPTVPTITGGSTEWAISRTISVSSVATDVGSQVAYYEYYKTSSNTAPTSVTTATGKVGDTVAVTSIAFSDHTAETGEYVYFRAVDRAGNKGEWSNEQRVYIDTQSPTAPTITGGSTEWAKSRTISVSDFATDVGSQVVYYEYYKTSSSTTPTSTTVATGNVGSTKTDTSIVFNNNTTETGEYVYFRAVDGAGNKGEWSNAQMLYIDIVSPIVTANNASITIGKGDSKTFESLFTVTWGGITTGNNSYTLNNASTSYTNTNQLAAGTHTLTCTANKNNGTSHSASVTIVVSSLPSSDTLLTSYNNNMYQSSKSFTVPADAKIIKVVILYNSEGGGATIYQQFSPYKQARLKIGTHYVAVTPGNRYTISADSLENDYTEFNVYYSSSINAMSPTSVGWYYDDSGGS